MIERLTFCALKRDGLVHDRGCTSHFALRQAIDPKSDYERPNDIPGYMTSSGRFLTRREAVAVGVAAGQLNERWLDATRDVLSSDINWSGGL